MKTPHYFQSKYWRNRKQKHTSTQMLAVMVKKKLR